MDAQLDLQTIYRQERQRWLREEAPRKSVREGIAESVPYWIILVALVLFGLSAPHTSGVFDKLTPGWGWLAPIGVEFGLLYTAFRRRLINVSKLPLPWTLLALEILLFLTAMLVNGAGSFTSVVAATQLDSLSFTAIIEGFGLLPATSQAALIMAVLSAFIIPIGTLVAGDGLAALALEQQLDTNFSEQRWQEVEFMVIYRAVFVRYMQQGLPERDARQRAATEVRSYIGRGSTPGVRLLSARNGQSGQPRHEANGQNGNGADNYNGSVKQGVRAFLDANPGLDEQSINQVLTALKDAGIQGGRTTVSEVLQERKQSKQIVA